MDYSLLMELACPPAYLMGKSLDMVSLGIFAFVRPSRRKTTLHNMDNCDTSGTRESCRSALNGGAAV
jgi:hypothetical protein